MAFFTGGSLGSCIRSWGPKITKAVAELVEKGFLVAKPLGWVSALDSSYGKRFVAHVDEKLPAIVELQSAIRGVRGKLSLLRNQT